ncbi:MarR family winged helix-turn-helix transcriptional regulator [Vibrio sp. V39_P1S14PM300]|uniref:MarR family winged helix-turn-helix transcriptional regulator n=1 Tax=Vibrio sp. V39_P1S14PM300 TaxID=1938690 RepID=UPI001372A577|nr:MarR family transcriptional regulator [Vibrio sp. V39_P1S14PM300]NAX20635.1 MarR family transcriptional regulator [Vibrio sp. V39_P1S14PM300]
MQDPVDGILRQWSEARPDLDCSAMGVVGRLRRVNQSWQKQLETVFEAHQLSCIEFDILATLRRSQMPLTPTELYQTLMLSSGAMSTRIEKLVQRGLIERIASENDRRSCKVRLSEEGQCALDAALESHVENMNTMLDMLEEDEKTQLAMLLKKVLVANVS